MSDETPDVRELKLTDLGAEALEVKLTLTEAALIVEAPEEAPLPDWLRGEVPFEGLDVVYIDPAKKQPDEEAEAEEEEEEEPLPPGFRVTRLIEIAGAETDQSFPRSAALVVDGAHVDLEQAEAFAATFLRLAGREKPEEPAAEAAPTEPAPEAEPVAAEAAPTSAPVEAPAFAAPSEDAEPEDRAFV